MLAFGAGWGVVQQPVQCCSSPSLPVKGRLRGACRIYSFSNKIYLTGLELEKLLSSPLLSWPVQLCCLAALQGIQGQGGVLTVRG